MKWMSAYFCGAITVVSLFIVVGCLTRQPFPDVPECVWVTTNPASGVCAYTITANKTFVVDDSGAHNYPYKGKNYTWSQLALMSLVVPPDSDASIKTWEQAECHQAGNCVNIGNWNFLSNQMEQNHVMVDRIPESPRLMDVDPENFTNPTDRQ